MSESEDVAGCRDAKPRTPASDAVLTCSEADWEALRGHLLQADGLEHVAFLLLGERGSESHIEYLVHRVLPVADSDCSRQSEVIVEPDTLTVLNNFSAYTGSEATVFAHAHSHPFTDRATFSAGDDTFLPRHIESFLGYLESANSDRPRRFLRLVFGTAENGYSAEVYDENNNCLNRIREIRLVGRRGVRVLRSFRRKMLPEEFVPQLSQHEFHDRNIRWLGEQGQHRISELKIAICGLGGIGVELLKHCRGLGFRNFVLVDPDRLEGSNLNRLIWSPGDVGKLKVDLAAAFLRALDPDAAILTFATRVEEAECQKAIESADLIVGAMDSDAGRLAIQLLAARHLKPLIDLGAGINLDKEGKTVTAMGGQVTCYVPGGPCLCCQGLDAGAIMDEALREVREAVGYVRGTNESPASVSTVNSIVGAIAGDLLIRLATGFGEVPLWTGYDMLTHETRRLNFSRRSGCRICGEKGIEGLGNSTASPLPSNVTSVEIFENHGSSCLAQPSQAEGSVNGDTSEPIDPQTKNS